MTSVESWDAAMSTDGPCKQAGGVLNWHAYGWTDALEDAPAADIYCEPSEACVKAQPHQSSGLQS